MCVLALTYVSNTTEVKKSGNKAGMMTANNWVGDSEASEQKINDTVQQKKIKPFSSQGNNSS